MADITSDESIPADGENHMPVASDMNSDQNFAYWLTMMPFLAIAAVFIFEFSKTPGEFTKLINAGGAVVLGIFAASIVNALTHGSDRRPDDSGTVEAGKAS